MPIKRENESTEQFIARVNGQIPYYEGYITASKSRGETEGMFYVATPNNPYDGLDEVKAKDWLNGMLDYCEDQIYPLSSVR